MTCEEMIYSEEYVEILVPTGRRQDTLTGCVQYLPGPYDIMYIRNRTDFFKGEYVFGYYLLPKLFGLLDVQAMEASGILAVRRQPALQLRGSGVLIGFIDTGIDFAGDIFRKLDGGTRVVGIWDQTIQTGNQTENENQSENEENKLLYGRQFSEEEIDRAVRSQAPYEVVNSRDEIGHGTYLASLAAGNELQDGTFTGAAPAADIAMVKLKPAKQLIRDYYLIREDAIAYQENDIMAGISYLEELARSRRQPLVICIALGTNQGSHNGNLPLSRMLDYVGTINGTVIVVGTGNETTRAHHYEGEVQPGSFNTVELRVGAEETERGFTIELWGMSPELFSLSIRSPGGEYIPRINVRQRKMEDISFLLERTRIELSYHVVVQETGEFLILLRFLNPVAGLWTFQVYNDIRLNGRFFMWLPMETFISPETVFLNPTPYSTLTSPSDAEAIISVSTYQYRDNSIYLYSGRGYRPDGGIRPDLAAPGVEIEGFSSSFGNTTELRRVSRSGSCVSTAIMAGASALLLEWAIVLQFRGTLTSQDAKSYFIRGAKRSNSILYPNREWGYGILDMYGVFEQIRSQERR